MRVEPTPAAAAALIGGLTLAALTARLWSQYRLETLSVGIPTTLAATFLLARKPEPRIERIAIDPPPPRPFQHLSNDELLKLALEWCHLDDLDIEAVDRELASRSLPLGERTFRELQHLPHFLHSLPREELYLTAEYTDLKAFVECFAPGQFEDLPVADILSVRYLRNATPRHVEAFKQLRTLCGLPTTPETVASYAQFLNVQLPDS